MAALSTCGGNDARVEPTLAKAASTAKTLASTPSSLIGTPGGGSFHRVLHHAADHGGQTGVTGGASSLEATSSFVRRKTEMVGTNSGARSTAREKSSESSDRSAVHIVSTTSSARKHVRAALSACLWSSADAESCCCVA